LAVAHSARRADTTSASGIDFGAIDCKSSNTRSNCPGGDAKRILLTGGFAIVAEKLSTIRSIHTKNKEYHVAFHIGVQRATMMCKCEKCERSTGEIK
jgi:hypothetical protein